MFLLAKKVVLQIRQTVQVQKEASLMVEELKLDTTKTNTRQFQEQEEVLYPFELEATQTTHE